MDPHISDSEDEDEDFVPGGGEDDEDVSDEEGGSKRKLEDDDDEEDGKPAKRAKKTKKQARQTPQTTATPATSVETEKKVSDIWEEMKKSSESATKPPEATPSPLNNNPTKKSSSSSVSTSPSISTSTPTPSSTTTPPKTTPPVKPTQPQLNGKPIAKAAAAKPQAFTFAGEKVAMPKPPRGGSALDNLVSGMSKKNNKLSVLDKSKLDWDKYKTTTGSSEELAHQKKNGYLEKVAFLQRTDERQFELEKKQRQNTRDNGFKQGLK